MAENIDREKREDEMTDDIDLVLSSKRKETPSAPNADARVTPHAPQGPAPAPQRQTPPPQMRPASQHVTPIQHAPHQGVPHAPAGQRIQPDHSKNVPSASRITESEKEGSPRRNVGGQAGRKMRRADREMTRVTDMSDKVEPKKNGKTDKKDEKDVGGTIVSSLLRTVIYIVSVTVIAVVLSIFVINVGNDVYAFVKSDEAIDVTIPENATREDIADILYENGVINYKAAFRIYGSLKHIEENFVAGDYTVTPMMNYKELYNAFKEKPVSGTRWITIPEGYTTDEIIALMLSYDIGGTKEDYVEAINHGDFSKYWFVKELDEKGYSENRYYRLDGYLFPDTYEFYNASDAYTVIDKLLARFDDVYNEKFKARAAELGMSTDEAVIIASMIEKEAKVSSDFRNVSAVFHNRLATGGAFLYLSSDATTVYAIQHDTGERPKEITADMMEYDSPYNTYKYQGLPPGAISNPGINALKYSLYPAENTGYYYFVSLKSGETLFARTEYEHQQNVARLRAEQG